LQSDGFRYDTDVGPRCPPDRLPKGNTVLVAVENEDVRLSYSLFSQAVNARFHKSPRYALPAPSGIDREMVKITASAVMTAENSTDDTGVRPGNKAHFRIPVEIGADGFPGVNVAQADAWAPFPQGENAFIRLNVKSDNFGIHIFLVELLITYPPVEFPLTSSRKKLKSSIFNCLQPWTALNYQG
jgi:hypothetical protein